MASTTEPGDATGGGLSPLRELQVIGTQQVELTPNIEHCELFTMRGLLTILWHGDPDAEHVVLMVGGARGGLLGPAGGLYHELGEDLAAEGIATMRISYRRANDLEMCTHDLAAAADLASRRGARSFITMGHSFGGAIAIRAALMLGRHCAGVATFATQSAGCEQIGALGDDVPLLLFHGEDDELLPPVVSDTVRMMAGHGDVVLLEGRGHLLTDAGPGIRAQLDPWIHASFAAHDHACDA